MSSFNRVGRALIKYFKPARVALPHYPGEKHNSNPGSKEQNPKDFKLIELKRPKDKVAESKKLTHTSVPAWEEQNTSEYSDSNKQNLPDLTQNTEKTPATWLNFVLNVFKACKKAGDKVRKKMGFHQYEKNILEESKSMLKAQGSIINTSADEIDVKSKAS